MVAWKGAWAVRAVLLMEEGTLRASRHLDLFRAVRNLRTQEQIKVQRKERYLPKVTQR